MAPGSVLSLLSIASLWSLSAPAADWPQLGNGPRHTGYSAGKLKPPLKNRPAETIRAYGAAN